MASSGEELTADTAAQLPVYDHAAALAEMDGDEYTVQLLLNEFLRVLPEKESAICNSYAEMDYPALSTSSQSLAGYACAVGATAIHAAALTLQYALKQQPLEAERIDAVMAHLQKQITRFRQYSSG